MMISHFLGYLIFLRQEHVIKQKELPKTTIKVDVLEDTY